MPPSSRILQANHTANTTSGSAAASPPPEPPLAVDSDVVVILAALLCALICVVGLAAVARCAWTRRSGSASSDPAPPPPNKGLKKKALESLPKIAFEPSKTNKLAECAICLAEFAEGEEVRILPQCGHGFHAACIDTWLGSHSSCPSCRRVLVVPVSRGPQSGKGKCRMCGGSSSSAASAAEMVVKAREDGQGSTYLP